MENYNAFLKAFIGLSESYNNALASANKSALSSVSNALSEISNGISRINQISMSNISMFPQINEMAESLSKTYSKMLSNYSYENIEFISRFTDLQIDSILQLSQSINTSMVNRIKDCFSAAHYNEMIKVINDSLSSNRLKAADIAFLKTSKLVDLFDSEIDYPKGLLSTVDSLNKKTANEISRNEALAYSTERNVFLSENGETNSKGLNVICAGKELLSGLSDELFNENELIDFSSFLYSTPMHGLENKVGKRISNLIESMFKSGEHNIDFDEELYYHCRSRNSTDMPFTYDQMLKAPIGLPWAGRYNLPGRSNFYFSNTQKGAEYEVKKHLTKDSVLQTVIIRPVKKVCMLDISGKIEKCTTFLRYLRFDLSNVDDKTPREYLIPCFVYECCKLAGFDGIKYAGSKDYNNYVTWNDGYFEYAGMCI